MTPKLLTTLKGYTRATFTADALAGLTVALVALPLSVAIAIASGATPGQGIVTAIVGGFLISLLGGSRVQIGGPTGAFIVVVYGVTMRHGADGLTLATLMAGGILLVAAVLRLGKLIALVPHAVIEGFTIGIAVVIAAGELKDAMGLTTGPVPAEFIPKLATLWAARHSFSLAAVSLCAAAMALIVGLRWRWPRVPSPLIAIAATSLAAAALGLPVDTLVSRYGALPAGLPMPVVPTVSIERMTDLLPSALIIAFLAGIESLLSAIVADRMIGGRHRSNAELMAQGAANIGSALFGGIPATGAIARTATNVRAGGRTPVAGLVHAVALLAMIAVAAPLVSYMAMPALAGLLLITAWSMSGPERWAEHLRLPLGDRLVLLLTMALTILSDLTVAIAVGTVLGLVLTYARRRRAAQPSS